MASIIKRKSKYSVVYRYIDEKGIERQKWETFATNAEAKKRKTEVEYQQNTGTFTIPCAKTVRELMSDFISIYGINTWALSTYDAKKGMIDNYINPILGDLKLSDITPRTMDKYYNNLLSMKCAQRPYFTQRNEKTVSPSNIKEIHKILRNAFNQAVKWELMPRNPVLHAALPKSEPEKRAIWNAETIFKALSLCEDDNLALAINLAFTCSLRMGEMLALTWDCVTITEESIKEGRACILVEKELQRASKEALELLDGKDVFKVFPSVLASVHTSLILKAPKTKTSVRTVYLPKTVAEMLVKHKQEQEEIKELMGSEYTEHNLVFASPYGRPIEGQNINRALGQLIERHKLPKVVFHSLRHSSITYKLKLNGGDMKSVQGDSGHAQLKMISDVYSRILDEDRCKNAQNFEKAFYSQPAQDTATPIKKESSSEMNDKLLQILIESPELATLLLSKLVTNPL